MNLLLDTHVWLWMLAAPERMGESVRRVLERRDVALHLSTASVWELGIKHSLGKVELDSSLEALVSMTTERFGVQMLPVQVSHVLLAPRLPNHHKAPFDRLLIAQALVEHLTLATADDALRRYEASLLWAL